LGWQPPLLRWNFILQMGTSLQETNAAFQFFFVDWNRAGHQDLLVVKKNQTGTNSTEVYIFSGSSSYCTPLLCAGACLRETDATFQFCVAEWAGGVKPGLWAIRQSRTGTGKTEVHILSGETNFSTFRLQTDTALHETDGTFKFGVGRRSANQSEPDLFAIKKSATGTHSTEIHVLSGASGFQEFTLHTGTPLHETGENFDFLVGPYRKHSPFPSDVIAIKKNQTGTRSTEIHVLDGRRDYQAFEEQSGSQLHETDATFSFALMAQDNAYADIAAIKMSATGTHSTEVHVLRR